VARRFALAGDDVTIVGRRGDVLSKTADELNADAGRTAVHAVRIDLSRVHDVERLGHEGLIDVLVNNAGGVVQTDGDRLAGVEADWAAQFRANVLTAVLLTTALESRLRRPGATIINVSSIAAVAGGGDSYSAAKAAIIGWTLDLAIRLGGEGIRVNAVVPGYVTDTEFFGERMTAERHRRLVARTLLGRAGTPDDVAGGVFFLASADAGHITGQLLHINGGALIGR
jgi:3-oxoacyl-[acyl-carrier protein] reductase